MICCRFVRLRLFLVKNNINNIEFMCILLNFFEIIVFLFLDFIFRVFKLFFYLLIRCILYKFILVE